MRGVLDLEDLDGPRLILPDHQQVVDPDDPALDEVRQGAARLAGEPVGRELQQDEVDGAVDVSGGGHFSLLSAPGGGNVGQLPLSRVTRPGPSPRTDEPGGARRAGKWGRAGARGSPARDDALGVRLASVDGPDDHPQNGASR